MTAHSKTAVAAMSGGVDSSVAAAILLEQGFKVVGVTLNTKAEKLQDKDAACSRNEALRAREVCSRLGIVHHVVNCSKLFVEKVLRPAWDEYKSGATPSPCIGCNVELKFRELLAFARRENAAFIATGHYARVVHGSPVRLYRGVDRKKDQSYFLSALDADQLEHTLFPLGELTKEEVRAKARGMDLPGADGAESQDACFAGDDGKAAETLRVFFGQSENPGEIVDGEQRVVGRHSGIHNFTIGQRKGLGVAMGERAYVIGTDAETGRVFLDTRAERLLSMGLTASRVRWTGDAVPRFPLECSVQVRYRSTPCNSTADLDENGRLTVRFEKPVNAVTPGQGAVLYDGQRVLGCAFIEKAY